MRASLISPEDFVRHQIKITDGMVERGEFRKACTHISKLSLYQVSCAIEFFNKWKGVKDYQAALLKLIKSIAARHEKDKHEDFLRIMSFFQNKIDYLLSVQDRDQLIQLFNEWDETTPKLQSLLASAIGRLNLDDFKMVNSFFLEISERYPNHSSPHIAHASFLLRVGKYAYALSVIDKVLLRVSEHKEALLCKARILEKMYSLKEADDFLGKLLERKPNFSQALHARAWIHIHLNDPDTALKMLEEINGRFPHYSLARLDYAIQLQLAHRFEDSLPVILDVISHLGKKSKFLLLANAHAALALAYRETKEYPKAEEVYRLICKESPWQWKAIYEYGDFLSKLQDFQGAIPVFHLAMKGLAHHYAKEASAHEVAKLYHSLSIAYYEEKQYELAKEYLKKAKKTDPGYAPIYSTEEHQKLAFFDLGKGSIGQRSNKKSMGMESSVRGGKGFLKHIASKPHEGFEVARRLDPQRFNSNHNPALLADRKIKVEAASNQTAMPSSNVGLQRKGSPTQSANTQKSKPIPKKAKPALKTPAPVKPKPAFVINEVILPIIEADSQIPEIIDLKKPDQIAAKMQSAPPVAVVLAPSYLSISTQLYNLFSCCQRRKSDVLFPSDKRQPKIN